MRTSNALKNISLGLITRLLSLGLTLFVTPLIFNSLGKDLYGINALITQTIGYLGLAELGIGASVILVLYKTIALKDVYASNRILAAANLVYRYVGSFIFFTGLITSFWLDDFFSIPNNLQQLTQVCFLIYLGKSAISYFFSIPVIALGAAQKSYKIAWLELISSPLVLLLNYVAIKSGYSLLGMAIISFAVGSIILMFQNKIAFKILPWIDLSNAEKDFSPLKTTKYVFIDKLLVLGVFQTDYILISFFLGPKYVASYALYTTLFNILREMSYLSLGYLSSGVGEMFVKDLKDGVFQLWKEVLSFIIYIVAISLPILYYLIPKFVMLWVGEHAVLSNSILIFFLVNFTYLLIVGVSTVFVNAFGFFKERMKGSLMELLLNIFFSIILIPKMGVLGATIGTAIGHLSVNSWFIPQLFFKSINKNFRLYFTFLLRYTPIILLILLSTYAMNEFVVVPFLNKVSWMNLITSGGLFFITSLACVGSYGYFDANFRSLLSRFYVLYRLRR